MKNVFRLVLLTSALLGSASGQAMAQSFFNRIASFTVAQNILEAEETSAEIIAASDDGMILIYTDSPNGGIGLIDLSDTADPIPLGYVDMGGEPTLVSIVGGRAYVGVNTSLWRHLAIVDTVSGEVPNHFSAGEASLTNVDVREERAFAFDANLFDVPRELDAVKWLDDERFVTANEGDYEGGSRGFSVWNKDCELIWDSGNSIDHLGARVGPYPEKRSGNKGAEHEGLAVGTFGGEAYIFVLLERASLALVHKDTGSAPEFVQAFPSGTGSEGAVALGEH